MDEVQAAVLRVKLRKLDEDNRRRRAIASMYGDGVNHPCVRTPSIPVDPESHVWHIYAVVLEDRASLIDHLDAQGVQTMIHYPCMIPEQRPFAGMLGTREVPMAARLQHEILSLPISPVMEDSQVERVVRAVNSWRRG
jgi:dTDP-4-amino-4,6-dideoxygalactose transaminase